MEKLLSPSALAMDWWRSSCSLVDVMASDSEQVATRGKIIENRVQHLGAKSRFFGVVNQLFNDGNPFQWCVQNLVGNFLTGLLELHRSLIQNVQHCLQKVRWTDLDEPRESLSSCGHSSNGNWGIISLLVVVAWPQTKQVSLMVYPVLPWRMNWVQTAHFSFGGFGGFLKRVCCFGRGSGGSNPLLRYTTVPRYSKLIHPLGILWGSWTLGVLLRPCKVVWMVMQDLPKRLPLKLTKLELRVASRGLCGIISFYRSHRGAQTGCLWRGSCALDGHVCNWRFGWWCTQENSLVWRWIRKVCKMCCWLRIRWGFGIFPTGIPLGTWEFTNGVTCPVPIGAAAKTFRLGLDLRESLSALFDGEVGPDNLSFPLWFSFTFSFHTSEGYESSKLELDSFPNAFVVFGLPFS